jgi:hypothetical protein
MASVWQEFYCGNCGGYFRVKLNMALNIIVDVCCPGWLGEDTTKPCLHKHRRCIKDGRIEENGRDGQFKEEICPPRSAYSKEPLTKHMKDCTDTWRGKRDGAVIKEDKDLVRDAFMQELWFEKYGGDNGGVRTALDD